MAFVIPVETFGLGRFVKSGEGSHVMHKYISKRPDGKGSWIYTYRRPDGSTYTSGEKPKRDLKQWGDTVRGARARLKAQMAAHPEGGTKEHHAKLADLAKQEAYVKKMRAAGHTHAEEDGHHGESGEAPPPPAPEKKPEPEKPAAKSANDRVNDAISATGAAGFENLIRHLAEKDDPEAMQIVLERSAKNIKAMPPEPTAEERAEFHKTEKHFGALADAIESVKASANVGHFDRFKERFLDNKLITEATQKGVAAAHAAGAPEKEIARIEKVGEHWQSWAQHEYHRHIAKQEGYKAADRAEIKRLSEDYEKKFGKREAAPTIGDTKLDMMLNDARSSFVSGRHDSAKGYFAEFASKVRNEDASGRLSADTKKKIVEALDHFHGRSGLTYVQKLADDLRGESGDAEVEKLYRDGFSREEAARRVEKKRADEREAKAKKLTEGTPKPFEHIAQKMETNIRSMFNEQGKITPGSAYWINDGLKLAALDLGASPDEMRTFAKQLRERHAEFGQIGDMLDRWAKSTEDKKAKEKAEADAKREADEKFKASATLEQLAERDHDSFGTRASKVYDEAKASKDPSKMIAAAQELEAGARGASKQHTSWSRAPYSAHAQQQIAKHAARGRNLRTQAEDLRTHARKLQRTAETKARKKATAEAMAGDHKPGTVKDKKFHLALIDGPKLHEATSVHGDYAVHKHIGGDEHGYQVTHVPTGMSVSSTVARHGEKLSKKSAESLARLMHEHAPGIMGTTFGSPVVGPGDREKANRGFDAWKAAETAARDDERVARQKRAGGFKGSKGAAQALADSDAEEEPVKKSVKRGTSPMSKAGYDMDAIDDLGTLVKAGGGERAGHKYISRKDAHPEHIKRENKTREKWGKKPIAVPEKVKKSEGETTMSKAAVPSTPEIRRAFRGLDGNEPLAKGLYKFNVYKDTPSHKLPEEYLPAYLDSFIEEATEHEMREKAHSLDAMTMGPTPGDPADAIAQFVMNELVAYMACNENLLSAVKLVNATRAYIADRIRDMGILKPLASHRQDHGDFLQGYMYSEAQEVGYVGKSGHKPAPGTVLDEEEMLKGLAHTRSAHAASERVVRFQGEDPMFNLGEFHRAQRRQVMASYGEGAVTPDRAAANQPLPKR